MSDVSTAVGAGGPELHAVVAKAATSCRARWPDGKGRRPALVYDEGLNSDVIHSLCDELLRYKIIQGCGGAWHDYREQADGTLAIVAGGAPRRNTPERAQVERILGPLGRRVGRTTDRHALINALLFGFSISNRTVLLTENTDPAQGGMAALLNGEVCPAIRDSADALGLLVVFRDPRGSHQSFAGAVKRRLIERGVTSGYDQLTLR